jgi:hypothetical protein
VKRIAFIGIIIVALLLIYVHIKRAIPDEKEMQKERITLDSFHTVGPIVWIYDRNLRQKFWLKSYTSLDASKFDSLRNRSAQIYYKKVFSGPFENRIFKLVIDSAVVFDQVVGAN